MVGGCLRTLSGEGKDSRGGLDGPGIANSSTFEPFTLPHAFHVDSMWTPGTLCGVYMESTYTQHNFFITERRVDSM
jgi:hypothetical protein